MQFVVVMTILRHDVYQKEYLCDWYYYEYDIWLRLLRSLNSIHKLISHRKIYFFLIDISLRSWYIQSIQ